MARVARPPRARWPATKLTLSDAPLSSAAPFGASSPAGLRDYAPAAALAAVFIGGLAMANLMGPGEPDRYVVIVPPWWAASQAMDRVGEAGGAVVDIGRLPNVLFVASDRPDFLKAARRSGGVLAFSSSAVFGCLGSADV